MREVISIAAEARSRAGKGNARATRLEGRVPAVIYGGKEPPLTVSVNLKELLLQFNKGNFLTRLFDIELPGGKQRVLPRDVQLHPVTDRPVHADFMRVDANSRIRIFVPAHFVDIDQSPGIKKGGVLNIVRHEVEFYCPANEIPERITISLAGLEIGTSIHISSVTLPAGVTPVISNRDFTVATIAAPTKAEETAAVAAAPAADAKAPAAAKAAPGAAPAAAAGGKAPAAAKAPAAKAPAAKK
jgi:large subunit ribosomal protein L25